MADKLTTKKLKLFRWLLPVIYLGAFVVLMIANILGAGHTPAGVQFLIPVVFAPCYLIEFVLPLVASNVFFGGIICVIFGTVFFIVLGLVFDLLLNWFRSKKPAETNRSHHLNNRKS